MKKTITVVTGGHGGMGKAICKELGKTSAIVLAGRNLAKMETAKAELDELGVESYCCKTDIADRAQVQALADYAASLGDVLQVIHTSGVSPSDTATENIIKINAVGTVNMVETICLLSKLNAKQHIEINLDMDELDLTDAEKKATYQEIKDYVLEHSGLKVSSLYIAQVKQKCGIIERENYNKPKSEDAKQPQCPPDKEKAIKEALTHFGMI